jgi:hypothetical protein
LTADVERLPDLTRDHRDYLWQQGWPLHLLYSHQRDLAETYHRSADTALEVVLKCGRRFGKSAWCVWEALTAAQRNPGWIILYAAPTAKQLRSMIKPHVMRYVADCPPELRPQVKWQDGEILFSNGSVIHLAGTDNGNAERLRGPEAHLCIVDEASFMAELSYLVEDIMSPQTATTDGRIIVTSTPPKQPAHDFAQVYVPRATLGEDAMLIHRATTDARHIKPERIERLKRKAGGEDSITWRREYLALDVYDTESSIVPEFVKREPHIVMEWNRPRYAKRYVVGDTGFVDLSFWLFAYVDFEKALVVVEDELTFTGTAASDQAKALAKKERDLWGTWTAPANDNGKPTRLADASDLVRVEFPKGEPGYNVAPVDNRDLDATVNGMRRATQELRYRIHPRCRQLIAHLKMGTWNKRRTEFERVDGYGHFDGCAALLYLLKHATLRQNPFPDVPPEANREDWHIPAREPGTGAPGLAQLKRGGAKR